VSKSLIPYCCQQLSEMAGKPEERAGILIRILQSSPCLRNDSQKILFPKQPPIILKQINVTTRYWACTKQKQ